ncbi:MAG: lytic transglycosylase domain-containing protein [Treponema sp.]|nr:lytic transglycosylase domain-containing protein [Treponema sp.]
MLALPLFLLLSCAQGGAQGWTNDDFRAYYLGLRALELSLTSPESAAQGQEDPASELRNRAYAYFERALKSSNPYVSSAAAEQLILPLLRGEAEALAARLGGGQSTLPRPLVAAALYHLGAYTELTALYEAATAPDPWDSLLPHLGRLRLAGDTLAVAGDVVAEDAATLDAAARLRDFLFGAAPGPILTWAAAEVRRSLPGFLSETEDAVLEGRLATARSSFEAGLGLFRAALETQAGLFQRYPALITDLGRCFQFAGTDNEGIELFLEWCQAPDLAAPDSPHAYQFLYFAGRIARARGDYQRSREFFTRALPFAPDKLQEDACIWYFMDTALREAATDPVGLVASWAARWNDPPYFDDILDRIASSLAAAGQWGRFPELLDLLHGRASRASVAKYAYISGRVIGLGLVPVEGEAAQGEATQQEAAQAAALPYLRLAYEAGEQALYYRALGAYFLGEPFLELQEAGQTTTSHGRGKAESARAADYPQAREMEFLLGFFDAEIPSRALPWLETMMEDLSTGELRVLAEAMEDAGLYADQIRLVSTYMGRDDYSITRRDLELISPRPFGETVEEEAQRAGLAPELLYGLIRTESAFQAEIVSWAGAVGLTQLMPATAADMADRIRTQGGPNYSGDMAANLRNPAINIHIGAYYLAYLLDHIEHPMLSILAYNGGMTRVRRWYREAMENLGPALHGAALPGAILPGAALPGDLFLETVALEETRNYGRKVVASTLLYAYLYYDVKPDSFLADICR